MSEDTNNTTDTDPEQANLNKQDDAPTEEEEKPRSPWISIAISVIVTAICFGISIPTSTYYECLVSYGVNWISFLFVAWPLHTEKYYDFTGMLTFLSCDLFSIFYNQVPWNADHIRNMVLFFMVMCWTLRLGIFLFQRITAKHGGKDKRFDDLRDNFARFAVAWTLQATWGYFCCMPLFIVNQIDNNDVQRQHVNNVTVVDIVGWALWVFGWGIELIADRQKTVFKNDPNNRGKFCNAGLWAWSRHPNYFGEITLWIGIFVSSASIAKNAGWLAVLSPIWTIILLVFSSGVPLAERTAMKKYGHLPEYQEYVKNVSVLIPLPCCWKGYI
eukprot:CAMPEP_0197025434 /NCGR_PEP_ID=MMETSP1384-20130603/5777_1 /TAXON_ID=29189 /ORGANISM="Ammonia sp." /LENGTH=328 /DNA_ID=CAMNT_0042453963 /DNA_START=106 /DNA_END=1092 /DNA_ORIENTATION=+